MVWLARLAIVARGRVHIVWRAVAISRIIPNERTWIGFLPEKIGATVNTVDVSAPTEDLIKRAVDLTCLCVSLNASFQGNTVPTPQLCSLFETSVPGTSQATFQGDFYRDDSTTKPLVAGNAETADVAYENLALGVKGWFFVSRFGGTGANHKPTVGDKVEVWPVYVTSRADGALASNTALTFSLTCSVPEIPKQDAVVIDTPRNEASGGNGGTITTGGGGDDVVEPVEEIVDVDAAEATPDTPVEEFATEAG